MPPPPTLSAGALHGLFLQYDTCASYDPDGAASDRCTGLCTVGWMTRWDGIGGARRSDGAAIVTVPTGLTLAESDKRRAGTWYVSAKALPGGCTAHYYTGPKYDPGHRQRGLPRHECHAPWSDPFQHTGYDPWFGGRRRGRGG